MKKLFALLLALTLVLGLSIPVFAADNYTVTIENTAPNHHYDAYQIFSGTLDSTGATLADIKWGLAIYNDANNDGDTLDDGEYDHSAALMAALKADTKEIKLAGNQTTTLATLLASVGDTAAALSDFLSKNVDPVDSVILDRIAEIIGTYENNAHLYMGNYSATSNEGDGVYTLSLPAGYYLIKDRDGTVENVDDFYTKYLIKVVGTQTIAVKGEGVSVEKFINDTVDGTYGDHEDFDINDTAYYMWQGQLPSNLLSYDEYYYQFVDTLPAGIEFIRFEAVYLQDSDGKHVHTFLNMNDALDTNDTLPSGITGAYDKNANKITLTITDLLASYALIQPDHEVVVKYSALITRDAYMTKAMTNEVHLIISNNPSGDGLGKTVPDYAHAFSFPLNVFKYDAGSDSQTPLEGAEFILYFTRIENEQTVNHYAKVITEEDIYVFNDGVQTSELLPEDQRKLVDGREAFDADDLGIVYGWTTTRSDADVLDTNADGFIRLKGLDAGIFYLEETEAPDGYNKLNSVITVQIAPKYTNANTENASVEVTYSVDYHEQGNNETISVGNSKGATLPTTGGMGTTIFYIVGGLMAAAAVVLLVTKKRMAA